jgi:hypothetical protein
LLSAGCTTRIPQPAGVPTTSPRVGWVIMTGDRENPDRDFVCQSDPRTECIAPIDRPEARRLAHVHFYYHGAATETKYTGTVQIGFFDQPHEIKPNILVKLGEPAGNQSVTDFVSPKAGTYPMSIAVVATSSETGRTQDIRDQVSVTLR